MIATGAEGRATRDELRRMIRAIEARPLPPRATAAAPAPLEEALRGSWTRRDGGVLTQARTLPLDYVHGHQPLSDLRHATGEVLALLSGDPEIASRSPADLLFLDIETTGLGGAGAMVFLVTTGRLAPEGFVLRQYLAPSPAEESPLLSILASESDVAAERPVLATYNGRVFDAPMLDQRSTMHRMRGGYEALAQLDILSPVRHGFRATLPSCRLSAVEYELLGVTRPGDEVGGAEVPGWYFRFVRGGDARHLEPLIAHNAIDVLSLAALTARLIGALSGKRAVTGIEHLAAGRLWLRAHQAERAEIELHAAIEALPEGWASEQARLALAKLHKHAGRRDLSAVIWAAVADRPFGPIRAALIELAMYHEHVARDYHAALGAVQRAIAAVGEDSALTHRRARLLRRLGNPP